MEMLVKNLAEMRAYVPSINITTGDDRMTDFLEVAQQNITDRILGASKIFENNNALKRAISLSAFVKGLREMDVTLGSSGFIVSKNEAATPASKNRVDKLLLSIAQRESDSLDFLVKSLVKDKDWRSSSQGSYFFSGLIPTLEIFVQSIYPTSNNAPKGFWQFFDFQSKLSLALMTKVAPIISTDYALELRKKLTADTLDEHDDVILQHIRPAIIAFALGELTIANNHAYDGKNYMLANIANFPTFAASKAAMPITTTSEDKPIHSFI